MKSASTAAAALLTASTTQAALITLYSQNFDSMTTSATAALPSEWRFAGSSPTWGGTTTTAVTQNAGTTGTGVIGSSSSGGNYLWVNGVLASGTDKAIGFLTSGSAAGPRSIMMSYTNNTGYDISSFTASWDYEKYRSGTRAFDWTFFSSTDGTNWSAVTAGNQSYSADANNSTVSNPPSTISKSNIAIATSVANGASLYLRWTYTGVGGSTNAQGLGIDNFSLVPAPGAAALIGLAGLITTRRRK
jgi:hypothetical protein